jgi:hypothetical protein
VRYAKVYVAGYGSLHIELDHGVGPATFLKQCNHPQQWFTSVAGTRVRASAIVCIAFTNILPQ